MTTYDIIYKVKSHQCDTLLDTVSELYTAIEIARNFFNDYSTVTNVWVVGHLSIDEMFSGYDEEVYFELPED